MAFAKEGARLIISGRRDEAGAKLVRELRESGAEAEYVRAYVRIEEDVHDLIDEIGIWRTAQSGGFLMAR